MCRQAGVARADTVEEAFDAAAVFATPPLPAGPNVVVVTTVGGWGVVTADAITRSDLTLLELPDDLRAALDDQLPPRWSRNNPIDLAGAETRDTVTEVLDVVARHDAVHAVVYLGIGIQSNQARMMREGPYFPEHGLGRVVEFHERQDARFARGGSHDLRRDRQADPRRERARGHRPRQRRAAHGARGRRLLRAVGDARRPRARAPLAPCLPSSPDGGGVSTTTRRVLAGLLVVAAAIAAFVAFSGGDSGAGPATTPTPGATTPLWSVRGCPEPVVDAVGEQHLQAALDAAAPAPAPASWCRRATTPSPRTTGDTPLIGASTQKLLVAAAALAIARTRLHLRDARSSHRPSPPTAPSTRSGWSAAAIPCSPPATTPSFLQSQDKTKGDVTTSLEALADAIVAKGVQQIPGGIVVDDSRYDTQRYRPDVEGQLPHRAARSDRSARSR